MEVADVRSHRGWRYRPLLLVPRELTSGPHLPRNISSALDREERAILLFFFLIFLYIMQCLAHQSARPLFCTTRRRLRFLPVVCYVVVSLFLFLCSFNLSTVYALFFLRTCAYGSTKYPYSSVIHTFTKLYPRSKIVLRSVLTKSIQHDRRKFIRFIKSMPTHLHKVTKEIHTYFSYSSVYFNRAMRYQVKTTIR